MMRKKHRLARQGLRLSAVHENLESDGREAMKLNSLAGIEAECDVLRKKSGEDPGSRT